MHRHEAAFLLVLGDVQVEQSLDAERLQRECLVNRVRGILDRVDVGELGSQRREPGVAPSWAAACSLIARSFVYRSSCTRLPMPQ
jgi:hypothetical protein